MVSPPSVAAELRPTARKCRNHLHGFQKIAENKSAFPAYASCERLLPPVIAVFEGCGGLKQNFDDRNRLAERAA